jgi:hypothetical protein
MPGARFISRAMFPLAATALDMLKQLPPITWLKIAAVLAGFVVTVVFFRKIAQMNKVVLAVIVFVITVLLFFNWVYERSEPRFLTPLVDKIAPFFPSKGSYGGKQQGGPRM